MEKNEIEKLVKELVKRYTQSTFQQDIFPDVIKQRHVGEGVRYVRAGLAADRPTSGEKAGACYWDTENNKWYIWTGTVWKYVTLGGHDITVFDQLSKITVGTTQPTAPSQGDLWVNTN